MANNIDLVTKTLDLVLSDMTEEQKNKLLKLVEKIPDPEKMSPEQAIKLINDLGIDIETMQKKARKLRAQEKKPKKNKPNDKCMCGSELKYKKCCWQKNYEVKSD